MVYAGPEAHPEASSMDAMVIFPEKKAAWTWG
jgi:hypothetical protein